MIELIINIKWDSISLFTATKRPPFNLSPEISSPLSTVFFFLQNFMYLCIIVSVWPLKKLRSNIRRGGGAEKQASHKEIHCVVPPANKGQFSFDFPPGHDFPPPPFPMEGTLCLVVTCYPLSYAMSYDFTWCPPSPFLIVTAHSQTSIILKPSQIFRKHWCFSWGQGYLTLLLKCP